jgi:hypothetical protein
MKQSDARTETETPTETRHTADLSDYLAALANLSCVNSHRANFDEIWFCRGAVRTFYATAIGKPSRESHDPGNKQRNHRPTEQSLCRPDRGNKNILQSKHHCCRLFQASPFLGSIQMVGTVPPSMTYSAPVIEAARGEARKATSSATSLGRAGRPIGMPPSESIKVLRAVS